MALVAYSDESDFSENEEEQNVVNSTGLKKKIDNSASLNHKPEFHQKENNVKDAESTSSHSSSKVEPSIVQKSVFHDDVLEDTDIVDDVPTMATWNVTKRISNEEKLSDLESVTSNIKKVHKKNKLRLILPALSQFYDDEDEDSHVAEDIARKRVKPSSSGTGLFALLPEPRGPTCLVPHHVARKKSKSSQPPISKKERNPETLCPTANDSDEEGPSSVDFFSLSDSPLAASPLQADSLENASFLSNGAATLVAPSNKFPVLSTESSLETATHSVGVDLDGESNNSSSSLPGIDEEALRRLAGRRNKGQVPTLIDINADDALMSREEWVTRTMCEEKPKKSFSRKKEGNPTQQQKRKHQITYLAHQAQEREQELQSAWGQNRFTKMQTQSKYGF